MRKKLTGKELLIGFIAILVITLFSFALVVQITADDEATPTEFNSVGR